MNEVRNVRSGIGLAHLLDRSRKTSAPAAPFHAFQHRGGSVLQGNIHVGADFFVRGDGFQQLAGDFVGIGVEKTDPAQIFDCGQLLQQQRQAIFQSEIFAVAGGVLPDQGDFAHAGLGQAFRLGNH